MTDGNEAYMTKKKTNKRLIIRIALLAGILWELLSGAGYVEMKKYSLESGIGYERTPLLLTRVEITNREDLNELYGVGDREIVYEVCLTARNPAAYTGMILDCLEFETEDGEYSLYPVYPENIRRTVRYADREAVVPAHKTGSLSCYLAIPKDSALVRIREAKKALTGGSREVLTVTLPTGEAETTVWVAEEALE